MYYITVQDGGRTGFLAGPFRRHGDAERMVTATKQEAQKANSRAVFYAFGTSRVKTPTLRRKIGAGLLNDRLGIIREDQ
jgi:hypothetical protein